MNSIQRLGLAAIALFVIAAAAPSGTTTAMTHGCWVCLDFDKSVESCEDITYNEQTVQQECNSQCSQGHGPWYAVNKCLKDPTGGKFCEGAENPFMFKCYRSGHGPD
jgi:hypothetical protein